MLTEIKWMDEKAAEVRERGRGEGCSLFVYFIVLTVFFFFLIFFYQILGEEKTNFWTPPLGEKQDEKREEKQEEKLEEKQEKQSHEQLLSSVLSELSPTSPTPPSPFQKGLGERLKGEGEGVGGDGQWGRMELVEGECWEASLSLFSLFAKVLWGLEEKKRGVRKRSLLFFFANFRFVFMLRSFVWWMKKLINLMLLNFRRFFLFSFSLLLVMAVVVFYSSS